MTIPVFQAIIDITTLIRGIDTGYTIYGSKKHIPDNNHTTADQGDTTDPATKTVSLPRSLFQIIILDPSFHDLPLYSSTVLG